MKLSGRYKYLLLAAVALLGASCSMDEHNEVCDYSVELRYDYNRENSANANVLHNYIGSISEYIFDENEILYAMNTITADECDGLLKSERMLPPGRYSVISWGNMAGACRATAATVGVTTRQQMELMMDNPCDVYAGYQNNGDRLFHAYRTFTVNPVGISRVRVDMVHSHLSLRFRVKWGPGATKPPVGQEYQVRIETTPSQYRFMPEYVRSGVDVVYHDTDTHDEYNAICPAWRPHIPTVYGDRNILKHRVNTNVDTEREAYGEFITFRLLNNSGAMLSLHNADSGMTQVADTKNLGDYFRDEGIELSRNLRQEFSIEILINADNTITLRWLDIAEWDEGGLVGFN